MLVTLQVADACLTVASAPALAVAGYLAMLTMWSAPNKQTLSRTPRVVFDVIIPAHNEEANVASTVRSVLEVDYPRSAFSVIVVADNCTDATAAVARAAGAEVLERQNTSDRGKGHALAHGFARSLARARADAVVVIDADTFVAKNLLRAFASRFVSGTAAVQAAYKVRNTDASWRTRLIALALALFHGLRSHARERLNVSCGLRGNGMGFATTLLRAVPYDAFSTVEDVEYGIRIGLAGHRVEYVSETAVFGEMVSSADAARSQRQRWESGRRDLARTQGWSLIRRGLAQRSALLFDLGADLMTPPLTRLVTWTSLGLMMSAASGALLANTGERPHAWQPWTLAAVFIALYVLRGLQLSGMGARGILDLARAPAYAMWKLTLPWSRPKTWIRTTREKVK